MKYATWIAVDWGTTQLRAWSMSETGDVLDRVSSDKGMSSLSPDAFEQTLLESVSPWLSPTSTTPVIACGMVGSRQGWIEVGYTSTPCQVTGNLTPAPVTDPRISVYICSGIKQLLPADVMRGEETQVAGLLAQKPDFKGVICLPGTHSKWVSAYDGDVINFQTFMTGELYALLADKSVLRFSVDSTEWDEISFIEAVKATIKQPIDITSKLFSLRAESLIKNLSPTTAKARLSGYLIGLELAAASQYWTGHPVAIIGANQLAKNYALALNALGITTEIFESEAMTLAGLSAAYNQLTRT